MLHQELSEGTSSELLDQVMALAGEEPASGDVEFAGADPVLPIPFRVGDAAAAAIGAAAVEAARLYELRTGRSQRVRVDVDAAAIAMRSWRYVQMPDVVVNIDGTGYFGAGFFHTKDDRWMYLRGVPAHHLARELEVLGCEYGEDSIKNAIEGWDSFELEEAIVANGAIGGVARTHEEWAEHPQGQAVAALPLFEIVKIGESAPEPMPAGSRPLSGIRALDVTRVLAGPTCARTLAEYGADVLRIGTADPPDLDLHMRDTGPGKRHAALDLKSPEGAETLRTLLSSADVFSQGYRPGALASLGFSPEEIAEQRPGIVYVTECAFSHQGPWRDRRGFDTLVEAVSGAALEMADPDTGKPRVAPCQPLDYTTGYLAAFAAMVALRRRATEGGSYLVRLSLAQTENWIEGLSRADPALVASRPAELPEERLAELMMTNDTPYGGTIRQLAPIAQLSVTPGGWDRPTAPLGHDQPEWW